MSPGKKSSFRSVATKWTVAALAVVGMFTHPVLGVLAAAVMVVAWACGRTGARPGVRIPAYTVAEAAVQSTADAASPTRHEVMRSWMLLF